MPSALTRTIAGFIAGALAVAIFHQSMYLVLAKFGIPLQGSPWNMAPSATAYGLPSLVNLMFWGGLWGVLYAFILERIPTDSGWLKGIIFGILFPMLLGSWLVVSLIKGRPILNGLMTDWNIWRLQTGFLLDGVAFGLGLGLLYPWIAAAIGGRSTSQR